MNELEAADEILAFSSLYSLDRLDVSRVPGLDVFRDRGVTFLPIQEPDIEDEMAENRAVARADIEPRRILAEALQPLGYTVTGEFMDGFVRLTKADAPADVAIFFLEKTGIPPYAILPRVDKSIRATVVLHVASELVDDDDKYNAFAHPLGLHVLRLRHADTLTKEKCVELSTVIGGIRSKVEMTQPASVPTAPQFDPAKVAEYSKTEKMDGEFEWATAAIWQPLVTYPFRFGNAFRGTPLPDGLFVQSLGLPSAPTHESALYDCKSKSKDLYGLAPSDADQQSRYLPILERLKNGADRIKPRGIILFTPTVKKETFAEQVTKEFWSKVAAQDLQLLVIPATALERLHTLTSAEETAFRVFFDPREFWRALFDQTLPGLVGEGQQRAVLGDRSEKLRLLTPDLLEAYWLAGIIRRPGVAAAVGEAARHVEPGDPTIKSKIGRPAVLQSFYKALAEKDASAAGIAKETGLSEMATRYLILHELPAEGSIHEFGAHGAANLLRLKKEAQR